MIGCIEIENVE